MRADSPPKTSGSAISDPPPRATLSKCSSSLDSIDRTSNITHAEKLSHADRIRHDAPTPRHASNTFTCRFREVFREVLQSIRTHTTRLRTPTSRPPRPNLTSRVSISSSECLPGQEKSIFLADTSIGIYNSPGVKEGDARHGIVLYDTGCKYNLISTSYLAGRRKAEKDTQRRKFAMSITGEVYSYEGKVDIRWKDKNFIASRYMSARCRIVDSDFFDVIIGWKTLQKLRLFVRNPDLIGPTLAIPPRVTDSQVAKAERSRDAKARRDKEIEDQDEEERKREQAQEDGP